MTFATTFVKFTSGEKSCHEIEILLLNDDRDIETKMCIPKNILELLSNQLQIRKHDQNMVFKKITWVKNLIVKISSGISESVLVLTGVRDFGFRTFRSRRLPILHEWFDDSRLSSNADDDHQRKLPFWRESRRNPKRVKIGSFWANFPAFEIIFKLLRKFSRKWVWWA